MCLRNPVTSDPSQTHHPAQPSASVLGSLGSLSSMGAGGGPSRHIPSPFTRQDPNLAPHPQLPSPTVPLQFDRKRKEEEKENNRVNLLLHGAEAPE